MLFMIEPLYDKIMTIFNEIWQQVKFVLEVTVPVFGNMLIHFLDRGFAI